jgi:hypothetical protein
MSWIKKISFYFLKLKCDALSVYFKYRKIEYSRWNSTTILYGQRLINIKEDLHEINKSLDIITETLKELIDYQEL